MKDLTVNGVTIGNSKDQVRTLWGKPRDIRKHPLAQPSDEGPPYTYWYYSEEDYVLFHGDYLVTLSMSYGSLKAGIEELPSPGSSCRSVEERFGPSATNDFSTGDDLFYHLQSGGRVSFWCVDGEVRRVLLGS